MSSDKLRSEGYGAWNSKHMILHEKKQNFTEHESINVRRIRSSASAVDHALAVHNAVPIL